MTQVGPAFWGGDNPGVVTLLMNMVGTVGSNTFTDESAFGALITTYGGATSLKPVINPGPPQNMLSGSGAVTEGRGAYTAILPGGANSLSNLGTLPFCIEMRVRPWQFQTPTGSYPQDFFNSLFTGGGQNGVGLGLSVNNNFKLGLDSPSTGGYIVTGPIPTLLQTYHLAGVRDGDILTLYVDGSPVGSVALPANYAVVANSVSNRGYDISGCFNASLGAHNDYVNKYALRFTRGWARYFGPFAPPAPPWTS